MQTEYRIHHIARLVRSNFPDSLWPLTATLRVQFTRYAIVGLASNILSYLLYLSLTSWDIGNKTAMSMVFIAATVTTFFINYSWSFGASAQRRTALFRYILVYLFGYLLNWLGLWLFVDNLGYHHQLIQLLFIAIVAVFLFANLHLWVFKADPESSDSG
jgi:putative flippase GtrA